MSVKDEKFSPTPPRHKIRSQEQEAGGYVQCGYCRRDIPRSVAMRTDADDYVRHFCGPDCYAQWKKERGRH